MKRFLFLQGPISPYFRLVGQALTARGHHVRRVNLCLGDWLFWRGPEALNYRGRLRDWPAWVAALMEREAITDLVLLGEQRPYQRLAIREAHARGIAVTATDFGYIRPDWIILERDGLNADSHFPRDPAAIRRLAEAAPPLDPRQIYPDDFGRQARWDVLFHLANTLPWPFPHYERFLLHHPAPGYIGTGWRLLRRPVNWKRGAARVAALPAEAPLFVFAMQMETDYSIRAYSRFPDMDTPLALAIRSFARHAPRDAHLVVKVHPLDPGLKRWGARIGRMADQAGVTGRVHYVDTESLEPILPRMAGMVTVNSTAGIRALQLGRPVIALGEALYRVPGLTHEGGLDRFWAAPEPPDAALMAAWLRAVAHHLQVRGVYYMQPGLDAGVAATVARLEQGAGPPPAL
ncbi:MAG: capsular biosynthesis protein [Acetobacteraceae bacterium]|nr:capsular biosynthesis protein [Acetobacteraceae bacterium]